MRREKIISDSIYRKLDRVRKPRVHITYEVETGGAVEVKELPFVVGVMGDFASDAKSLKPLRDRKFTIIDRDNFNDVMASIRPELTFQVENTLPDSDGKPLPVNLEFKTIEDFEPARVASQIEPLRKLLERRDELRDLLTKVDRSGDLENILERVVKSTQQLSVFSAEFTSPDAAPSNEPSAPGKES